MCCAIGKGPETNHAYILMLARPQEKAAFLCAGSTTTLSVAVALYQLSGIRPAHSPPELWFAPPLPEQDHTGSAQPASMSTTPQSTMIFVIIFAVMPSSPAGMVPSGPFHRTRMRLCARDTPREGRARSAISARSFLPCQSNTTSAARSSYRVRSEIL